MRKIFLLSGLLVLFSLGFIYVSNTDKSAKKEIVPKTVLCHNCNVILVAYDALQAKHVSHLGYSRETTPMIDRLAGQGVTFSQNISAAPWTVPSYMSIFTGLYPTKHKIVNKYTKYTKDEKIISNLTRLSPDVQTLAQIFKAEGYATGGFTGDAGVGKQFGYDLGFDVYTDEETFGSIGNAATHALKWLTENKDRKFFMFLQGYDSHGQFKLPDNYKGRFMPKDYKGIYKGTPKEQRDLREEGLLKGEISLTPADVEFWRSWYDSKIRDADDRFANFWQEFEKLGLKEKTIVVIFSDHGTEFYEHKRFDHGHSLYDELIRVPLVYVVPGLTGGKTVDAQVTTLDIAPTILELLGIKPPQVYKSRMKGASHLPFMEGTGGSGRDVFMETDYRDYTHKRGIRTADGWKFILTLETGKKELFDLKEDPSENINVTESRRRLAFELEQKVKEHMKEMGSDPYGKWETGCLPVYGDQCQ